MSENIKISCIMPVYNSERYLKQTLSSLLAQTMDEIEIICIDDASVDHSLPILREFAQNSKKIRIITNNKRKGAAASRNKGFWEASGEFVIFLDSDDFFYPKLLETAYASAKDHHADLVVFGYERVFVETDQSGNDRMVKTILSKKQFEITDKEMKDMEVFQKAEEVPWNKMISRNLMLDKHILFQDIPSNNDVFYSMAAVYTASRIVFTDHILLKHYMGGKDSITKKRLTIRNYVVDAYQAVFHYIDQQEEQEIRLIEVFNYMLDFFITFLCSNIYLREVRKNTYEDLKKSRILQEAMQRYSQDERIFPHNRCFIHQVLSGQFDIGGGSYYDYYLEGVKQLLTSEKTKNRKVALWGCGKSGKQFIDSLDMSELKLDYVIDEDIVKQGKHYKSYIIFAFDQIIRDVDTIIVLNSKYMDEIREKAEGKRIVSMREL